MSTGSDQELVQNYEAILSNDFKLYVGDQRQKRKSGGFLFNIGYPAGFEKYGLYQHFDKKNYLYSCFITAIINACDPSENVISNLKILTKGKLFIKTQNML